VKVQEAWLLHASVAILVTVVTPTGKVLPLAGILTMSVTLQLLVAVTRKGHVAPAALTRVGRQHQFVGQVIIGGRFVTKVTAGGLVLFGQVGIRC